VQAGPLLVHDGRSVIDDSDREGFSAGAAQFDSDITSVATHAARSGSARASCSRSAATGAAAASTRASS
jgi:hypothetical protein